jgi:hypothetical protein
MNLKTRIGWHVAFYLITMVVYLSLSDGHGRFEFLTRLTVFLWPIVAAIDVAIAHRKPR